MINGFKKKWKSYTYYYINYPKTKLQKVIATILIIIMLPFVLIFGFGFFVGPLFILFGAFSHSTIIDYPIAYVISEFNKSFIEESLIDAIIGAITYSTALIGLYFWLFQIPYSILKYRAKKKYIRENQQEYLDNFKSKHKEYTLSKSKKIKLAIYSLWFSLIFLLFKHSIFAFIRHLNYDDLFGIGGWMLGLLLLLSWYVGNDIWQWIQEKLPSSNSSNDDW